MSLGSTKVSGVTELKPQSVIDEESDEGFALLFQTSQRGLQPTYLLSNPLPSSHTRPHTHTPSERKKKERWVSVTPSEPQRNMIIASDRLYSPVPRGISLNQQPLLLINLYIYLYIYTYIYFFPLFRENYSTYNQKYDIKSRFLAWRKRNKCKKLNPS